MSNRTDIVVETDNAEGQVLLSASRVYDLTEDKTQNTINSEIRNTLNQLDKGLAIIVNGDTCTTAVPVGGYAYIKNNTHGLAEGLYTNASASAFPTSGGTANSSVFTAVSGGGLNSLKNSIGIKQRVTISLPCTIPADGFIIVNVRGIDHSLPARIIISVNSEYSFRAAVPAGIVSVDNMYPVRKNDILSEQSTENLGVADITFYELSK